MPQRAAGERTTEASLHPIDDGAAQGRWAALWEASPQRTPFSALPFVRTVAAELGVRCAVHLVSAGGRDVAGALVLWRRRGPYRQVVVPPFVPYAALLTRDADAESRVNARRSAFEALLEALEARYHVLRFALPPAFTDVRPALWRGWTARPFYTHRLPLAGLDPAAWTPDVRRRVRRQAGLYRLDDGSGATDAAARLCAAGYARHGRQPPLPADRLARLLAALHGEGLLRLFTVTPTDGDAPDGAAVFVQDGREAAYWLAGSVPGPAMTVLLGQALPRLQATGLARVDFVGANTPSIAEFKRSFGPALHPYYRIDRCTRPELALLYRVRGA